MLRIRWVDDPSFLEPYGADRACDEGFPRAIYSHEFNEIVLVRSNIWSKRELAYVVFHEFVHYLIHRLHLPRKLSRFIDSIDWRIEFREIEK